LFEALARFTAEYSAIQPYLADIPKAAFQGGNKAIAQKAIARMYELINGAAKTWKAWANPALEQSRVATADPSGPGIWQYRVDFSQDKQLTVTRSIVKAASGNNASNLPPWPAIAGYTTPTATGDQGVYKADGSAKPNLQLSWPKLFIMTHQSARAAAYIERNADFSPAFVYKTALAEFPQPVVPFNELKSAIVLNSGATLRDGIDGLFKQLTASNGTAVPELKVSLSCGYDFQLSAGTKKDQQLIGESPILLVQSNISAQDGGSGAPLVPLSDFEQKLASALVQWHKAASPAGENPDLALALTLFATVSTNQLPLVRFEKLEIPIPKQDNWWSAQPS
jgi:hypothetical protein